MSNLFKKVTSTVGVIAVAVSSVSSTLTVQAASTFAPYADALATAGIIGKQSSETGYRLGDSVTRAEMAKIAVNIKGAEVKEVTGKVFSDVTASLGDLAKYIEAAAEAGLVSKTNAKFRPLDLVTRAEALKMLLNAKGIAPITEDQGFKDIANTGDLAGYINAAAKAGIINKGTSFNPNNTATRGESFKIASNAAGLTTSAVEDNGGDDLDLGDLFGDTTSTGTTSTGTTDTTTDNGTTTVVKAGDLEVSLAASTPASADLPNTAEGVAVAKFDLTAGSQDISVTGVKLTRKGLGASSAVNDVALFANDTRVSKAKTFNSSDDTAEVVISPALVVKAGSTVTLTAKVNTKSTTGTFALELTDVASSAANVTGTMVTAASFEVKSTTATKITPSNDGDATSPKLGTTQAEVLKFKLKNDTVTNEDVSVSEITLKEDGTIDETTELSNVTLYYNGTEVAKVASMTSKYVTFKLATPVVIKDSKTEKFVVKADIIGGAGDTIEFILDNDLDITASASKYGYVSINGTSAGTVTDGTTLTVQAGEVTLVQIDPTTTKVLKDKDDVVLGKIKIVSNAGKNLEIEKFRVTIAEQGSTGSGVSDLLDNIELYDETRGTVYDLKISGAAGATEVWYEEVNLSLPATGELVLAIRADTANSNEIANAKFTASVSYDTTSSSTAGNFAIKELSDDKYVTDVTPASLSFKSVEGTSSALSFNKVAITSTGTAVIGAKDVEAMIFELKNDNDASELTADEVKVKFMTYDNGTAGSGSVATNAIVNAAYLYNGTTLLDKVSGSNLASGVATFDGFKVVIGKNASQRFTVKLDIVDDQTKDTDTLVASVTSYSVEDADSDDVYASGDSASSIVAKASDKTIVVAGAGTLTVATDNTDSETDKAKNVLANTTSPFVASFEFTSKNEGVLVKDLTLTETGSSALKNAVSTVILYGNDKTTELGRQTVTSDTVTFDNVNFTVAEGTQNVYVKVITSKQGKDEAGAQTADLQFTLDVTDAEGASSHKTVTASDSGSINTASTKFSVLPVRVSNVTFVDSFGGVSRTSKLVSGSNNVAIVKVTTDSSTNTDNSDGSSLKTQLTEMTLDVTSLYGAALANSGTTLSAVTIEKINGGTGSVTASGNTVAGGSGQVVFNMTQLGTDADIDNGSEVYYVVKMSVSKSTTADNDDYVKAQFNALSGQFKYKSDSTSANNTVVTDPRFTFTKLDGTQISE